MTPRPGSVATLGSSSHVFEGLIAAMPIVILLRAIGEAFLGMAAVRGGEARVHGAPSAAGPESRAGALGRAPRGL